jgi:lipopolysaccharide transport system ATP-binding protein
MSDVVISAEGIAKKYVIGHERPARSQTVRDVIASTARVFWRKADDMIHGRPVVQGDELEEVWALSDVNFEVKRGEVLGIIGRNGAGKSTLLKILSRIVEPTHGQVTIVGRVASLLEVGTGFHPELSGRENIFLNGAILGMGRSEIRSKFDEIVSFAEVEKFLDTPVKRYSSGMYMRLAFAVAAHLEPEILIVDEVLAVGDAEFQKKCLGKMSDVAKGGRTVLFVSHNMGAVTRLCGRALLLTGGKVAQDHTSTAVVDAYLADTRHLSTSPDMYASASAEGLRIASVALLEPSDHATPLEAGAKILRLLIECELTASIRGLRFGFLIETSSSIVACGSASSEEMLELRTDCHQITISADIDISLLNAGEYFLTVAADRTPHLATLIRLERCISFAVTEERKHLAGSARRPGVFVPEVTWRYSSSR